MSAADAGIQLFFDDDGTATAKIKEHENLCLGGKPCEHFEERPHPDLPCYQWFCHHHQMSVFEVADFLGGCDVLENNPWQQITWENDESFKQIITLPCPKTRKSKRKQNR